MPEEVVRAVGHTNVAATHTSTLELTTDDWLTPAGDCIVGIEADRAPATFKDKFVDVCQSSGVRITLTLETDGLTERLRGRGDPALTFASPRSLVARTSDYVDDRTVLVEADKAAADLDRYLVRALQDGRALTATLSAAPR